MDYKDSTNQSDWIRSDQISSRPDPLETVEDQRRTFESAYKKESVLAIVAIVSFLCIFGSIHIPAIICDNFRKWNAYYNITFVINVDIKILIRFFIF